MHGVEMELMIGDNRDTHVMLMFEILVDSMS